LINVYWNEYGLIQTDDANDIVVYSFLTQIITESITMHSVHLPFQCSKVYRLHDQKYQDNSFSFRFQIGNDRQSKRLLANSSFIKSGIRNFLLDIYSACKSFVWTAALGLAFSGSNDIVLILPLY
jgi:hypothetical protein